MEQVINVPASMQFIQAESGFMFINGEPESGPTKMPVALTDLLTASSVKRGDSSQSSTT